MIQFGWPWALAAGAMLATGVAILHLLAPQPPDRAPLPTARFLREDARTTLRFRRRPTDRRVMGLRMALALLLGALFAAPRWVPRPQAGTTRLVLLDRGAGMGDSWEAGRTLALAEASDRDAWIVPFGEEGDRPIRAADADLSDLPRSRRESSYLQAFGALRRALSLVGGGHVEAVLVTRARWSAWDEQLTALRASAWPGQLRIVEPPLEAKRPRMATAAPAAAARALLPEGTAIQVVAALEALGYNAAAPPTRTGESTAGGALRFLPDTADLGDLGAALKAGDTVVVFGSAPPGPTPELEGLWDPEGWPAAEGPRVLRVGSRILTAAGRFASGRAAATDLEDAILPIVLEDGAPMAAARRIGPGCVIRFGGPLGYGAPDPSYPALLRALADGCRRDRLASRPAGSDPLDEGARAALAGAGPLLVPVTGRPGARGRPLEAWFLVLALLTAVGESVLMARSGRRRADAQETG